MWLNVKAYSTVGLSEMSDLTINWARLAQNETKYDRFFLFFFHKSGNFKYQSVLSH